MAEPQDEAPSQPPPAPAPATEPAAASKPAEPKPDRPWYIRAFSLSVGQAIRLVLLSTLAGFFVLAFDYAPTGTRFNAGGAFTAIIHRALTALGWAFESFWKPALAGLIVVLPIWAIWRLATLPFRKK